ncbi:endonuclease/exonuclease/phosphatase family protein [Allorhodopirellula heiligendammensis]|uniref:Endonuclease/Exonuclease/phosphatase family protein n=1 Tax=Allorhodopirellula heiligendammensis TaxID=2714739 RepID=A0A5C6C252_9BACT|nr:endonuclease/exonuclease/phosphatase family protein [Allorhodopirellula heiligendammensis]TWU18650.1 Endonuclease/Exonuclease/phosphatase family protein [Allorhodopirellula heiligendammensis]
MDQLTPHCQAHRLDDGHRRPPTGKDANVVKWIWSTLMGKKSSGGRKSSGVPLVRWFTPSLTISGVVMAIAGALTGQVNLSSLEKFRGSEEPVYDDPISASASASDAPLQTAGFAAPRRPVASAPASYLPQQSMVPAAPRDSQGKSQTAVRLASFNIQVFGESKSSKPDVMHQLAVILMQFDVIAVQEVRGDPAVPIEGLLREISRLGGRYRAIHGPPVGRTSQKECYSYFWDQDRIDMIEHSEFLVDDRDDRMHREPFVCSFQTRVAPVDSRLPFRFTMINVHTDPDEVRGDTPDNELNVLDDVFQSVRNYEYQTHGEDDFILLGDLNVDVDGLRELGQIPGMVSLIGNVPTNTRQNKCYDHMLIDARVTTEFLRRSGVLNLERFFGIDQASALKISDHYPVWAEFSVYEAPRNW